MQKQNTAELIIASSENDSNMLYATRFFAPDPFIFLRIKGKKFVVMSDLELDRAKSQIKTCKVLSFSGLARKSGKNGIKTFSSISVVDSLLRKNRVTTVEVPANFPVRYADELRKKGHRIIPKPDPFFKQRAVKTKREIAQITKALRATEAAVSKAIRMIQNSEIRENRLYYENAPLTSERVKNLIHIELMKRDCVASRTIVASGKQGWNPHHEGSGPLLANRPIIIDVFPHSSSSHYYADLTRTVCRGKASSKLKRMYEAVREAQAIGFRKIRHGANGKKIHAAILGYFEKKGFKTGVRKGNLQGFFHSTGHGLGLDVHEPPRISSCQETLRKGQVVTIEPGLYYPDIGGVRLEDLVVVTKNGCENLTRLPKQLEL